MTNKELFNFVKNKRGSISRDDNCNRIIDGSIQTLEIPSVSSIRDYAFYDCRSLTSVTIPERVARIGNFVFDGCHNLTSVTLPNSVTSIGTCAFQRCGSLTSITIPSSVTDIGTWAFASCGSLTSITIPSSVTIIENGTFYGCRSLTSITIPSSVTDIVSNAFFNCSNLENVTLEEDFQGSGLNLSASTKFSVDTMIAMFNALADLTVQQAKTLTLGSTNLAKLTNEQIAIATEKNWTLA